MSASAPDVIEVKTERRNVVERKSLLVAASPLHARWGSWTVSIVIFFIAACATFNGALAVSGNHRANPPVVQIALPSLPALLPTMQLTLPPLAVGPQSSKGKVVDEAAAYDEVRPHHVRKRRVDERAAYTPRKKSVQPKPAKANPSTNW